jgi:hypothetical protein
MIKEIYTFNTELLGVKTGTVKTLDKPEFDWLLGAFFEEIEELRQAFERNQTVEAVDALFDLSYFAVGALVRMGLTQSQMEECFNAIHQSNMAKKSGVKETRPQDGSIADAVKPTDWQAPEEKMKAILFPSQLELGL